MVIRDQILAEATRRFAARGFDATTLKEIAEGVGIRSPSLLYHFKTKDELRRAVLEKLLSHWNDVLPRLLRAAASGEDQFERVAQEMVAFFAASPDRARLLVREVMDRPEEIQALIASHVLPWTRLVCDYIRKGQAEGDVQSEVDPEAYVIQVINLVVFSVATLDCFGALLEDQPSHERVWQRQTAELLRVARQSLFER